uniref:CH-like domain-containing protein n=1 Tax=Strigamia maritima TaxID=126957 RepID=T1JBR6_STRMM
MHTCNDAKLLTTLPRDVVKWICNLGLTKTIRNPKWDFASGYLIADIFTKYYPRRIELYKFDDSTALKYRKLNWEKLERFLDGIDIRIPWRLMEGTANYKDDAAIFLLIYLYELFVGKRVRTPYPISNPTLMDLNYQRRLPLHARATVAHAIRRNLKIPELTLHYSKLNQQQKVQIIIDQYAMQKQRLRFDKPNYFDIRPSIGERAVRKVPSSSSKFHSAVTKVTITSLSSKALSGTSSPIVTGNTNFPTVQSSFEKGFKI